MRQSASPVIIPAIPPDMLTYMLSHQKVAPIDLRDIPKAERVAIECCFSMMSMQSVLIILKEAISRMKIRSRNVTHFSISTEVGLLLPCAVFCQGIGAEAEFYV